MNRAGPSAYCGVLGFTKYFLHINTVAHLPLAPANEAAKTQPHPHPHPGTGEMAKDSHSFTAIAGESMASSIQFQF